MAAANICSPAHKSLSQARIHFDTAAYFERNRLQGLYPYIEIVFTVSDEKQHYHIPLLLTANSYTTYRGS